MCDNVSEYQTLERPDFGHLMYFIQFSVTPAKSGKKSKNSKDDEDDDDSPSRLGLRSSQRSSGRIAALRIREAGR